MPTWLLVMQSVIAAIQVLAPEIEAIIKGLQVSQTPAQAGKLSAYVQAHQSLAQAAAALTAHHVGEMAMAG